jgi:U6 snRNA-associated Sm-like protein LSm7
MIPQGRGSSMRGGGAQYHHRGGGGPSAHSRGGGGSRHGGPQGPQPTLDKPKREAILDLAKYVNARIRVKFTGGREGVCVPAHRDLVCLLRHN